MSLRVKAEKRRQTWHFLIAFLLGAVFAELTADPVSDLLFFYRSSQGALSPVEQVFYWYYLPALVYASLFCLAVVFMFAGGKARDFSLLIVAFAGVSLILSLRVLGANPLIFIMLLIPLIALAYVLTHTTVLKYGRSVKRL